MDGFVCVGLSYKSAPVELRGRVDLAASAARSSLVGEYVLLRTCYRVELYATLDARVDPRRELLETLFDEDAYRDVREHLYVHRGEDAARHLCRVAAGLDSIVLGETEVLGQVGTALEGATEAGTVGPATTLLFRTAISAGRRARTQTSISTNPATASSMALSLADKTLGDLRDRSILVIGTGKIGQQTTETITRRQLRHVAIAGRTRARATELAAPLGAAAYGADDLERVLPEFDVVIAAARSSSPVVTEDAVRTAMDKRAERPLVIVDLAVPENVERSAGALPGVHVFDVDDLRAGLDEAKASRLKQVPKVESIIEEDVAELSRRHRELEVEPILSAIRRQAESLRRRELDRALRELGDVDPHVTERVEHLTRTLVKKLLHHPTVQLRERAGDGDGEQFLEVVQELFQISASDEPQSERERDAPLVGPAGRR
jgi:glutamyl-tRNA reductase